MKHKNPSGRGGEALAVLERTKIIGAVALLALCGHADPVFSQATSATSRLAGQIPALEEVVVTAEKRSERLQDVPIPVTAISADTLIDKNQLRLAEYYSSIPGLNMTSGGQGDLGVSIRGITTAAAGTFTNPTVGITVDDVPFGSSTGLGGGTFFPDIDPSDLARIEVLRGPQGTLYGASSIGGEIKFVTADPTTDAISGRVQADLNSIYNSHGVGYGARAAVNVTLGDTVAVRVSGSSRQDRGYIDDPLLQKSGVNQVDVNGGRFSVLWRPSDIFSLKLSAFLQKTTGDGTSSVPVNNLGQPLLGDLQQSALRGSGEYTQDVKVYSATFDAKLGRTHLTAVTGYQMDTFNQTVDLTTNSLYGGFLAPGVYGVSGSFANYDHETKKFTQEIRWSSSGGQSLDWLLGVFYTHEDSPTDFVPYAANPATGASVGLLFTDPYPTKFAEYAGFGDLTWHITNRFDVELGARKSEISQIYQETISGPGWLFLGFPGPSFQPPVHSKDNAFTYLVTPKLKVNADLMMYARLASGYRPGGPNPTCQVFGAIPCHFNPDKTINYELGLKGNALHQQISFDASIYYIKWKDIQLNAFNGIGGYLTNASSAKSEGIELAAETTPLKGLKLSAWVAFNNGVLTSGFPPTATVTGVSGDRLPFSSRFSGNLSVDDEFPLATGTMGFLGGSVSYIGDRDGDFPTPPQVTRPVLPSYTKIDFRAGVRYESWKVSLFANNVADKRGVVYFGVGLGAAPMVNFIQPRTIGLSLSRNF
jgi:outer membrane receptor protein involved in Fe transport